MERYTEWDSTHTHGCGLPGKDCYTKLAELEDAEEQGLCKKLSDWVSGMRLKFWEVKK